MMEIFERLEDSRDVRGRRHKLSLLFDFTSTDYFELMEGMTQSFSDKSNPWDNACIEAFHAIIKREWFSRFQPLNLHHAHSLAFEYIEGFYNSTTIHSHCYYQSPNQYEKQFDENRSN